jgi:UDP-2,3-diacylglucosamine pyrophosphatase LpxH
MLAILGDIHGGFQSLRKAHDHALLEGASALIQVGDFGLEYGAIPRILAMRLTLPIYFIDGNHDNFSQLRELPKGEIVQLAKGLFYCGRGSGIFLDGRKIVFLGGAGSIDKDIRLQQGMLWQADEQITEDDYQRTVDMEDADLLITHCPPQRTITKHFETPEGIAMKVYCFGVAPDWSDPSAAKVEAAWAALGFPRLICGHMHRSVVDEQVQILNCDELVFV